MTRHDLAALDGPALTKLAWEKALAPAETIMPTCPRGVVWQHLLNEYSTWEPHTNLDQARRVFDQLRTREWRATVHYNAADPRRSYVEAWKIRGPFYKHSFVTESDECRALLIVSLLAVMSETLTIAQERIHLDECEVETLERDVDATPKQ